MYAIISKETLSIIALKPDLSALVPGYISVEVPDDYDLSSQYVKSDFTLVDKIIIDYTINNGILTINNTGTDLIKVRVMGAPDSDKPGIIIDVFIIDLSVSNTLDLSNYIGDYVVIYGDKYKNETFEII